MMRYTNRLLLQLQVQLEEDGGGGSTDRTENGEEWSVALLHRQRQASSQEVCNE